MLKKLLKKGTAVFMTVLMLSSLLCVFAGADGEKTDANTDSYALTQTVAIGIMEGSEGDIRENDVITRAEAVAALLRVISMESAAEENTGNSCFYDVSTEHWALGYINTAYIKGFISGKPDGSFGPEDTVTRFQMIKMLVCVLGYKNQAEESGAPYPDCYLDMAKKLGITDEIYTKDEPLLRGTAAELLYNGLFVPYVDEKSGETEELAVRFGVSGKKENPETREGKTYYLSPEGDDEADGSEEAPWKKLSTATKRLNAGDTLILKDGEYYEDTVVLFKNGGTEKAPITVTAENKHGAKIIFKENLKNDRKFMVDYGQNYVTVQYLEMTQEAISETNTNDIYIALYGDYCAALYNKIYYGFEEGIKSHGSKGLRIIGNEVYDMVHEAIDVVNIEDAVIANNTVKDWSRVGIMVKGGSRNIRIYNNWVECSREQKDTYLPAQGIGVGGSTDNHSGLGSTKGFYEAYNYAVYNNIVYCPTENLLSYGIAFCGAKDSTAFNNVVYGAKTGIGFYSASGTLKGWEWDPDCVNPVSYNNIVANCSVGAYYIGNKTNMISDYNLFYKTQTAPIEPHSIYKDPKFMEAGVDFRLKEDSPARNSGRKMPSYINGYYGERVNLDLRDYSGNVRDDEWSMGAYVFGSMSKNHAESTAITANRLMFDNFDYENSSAWTVTRGDWQIKDGVLSMTNKDSGRSMILYNAGLSWTDYTVEADVEVTDSSDTERDSGILFRGDKELSNVYAFRFLKNESLELCKWTDGVFASIQKWEFNSVPGKIYKMKVKAEKDNFLLYVDDELIGEVKDSSFLRGTVGFYAFYAPVSFDNIIVTNNK